MWGYMGDNHDILMIIWVNVTITTILLKLFFGNIYKIGDYFLVTNYGHSGSLLSYQCELCPSAKDNFFLKDRKIPFKIKCYKYSCKITRQPQSH
jgi:hypothetical protein